MTTPMRRRCSPTRLIALDLVEGQRLVALAKGQPASYQDTWDEIKKALALLLTRLEYGIVDPHPLNLYDIAVNGVPIARFEVYEKHRSSPPVPRVVLPSQS